jgi:predicted permease
LILRKALSLIVAISAMATAAAVCVIAAAFALYALLRDQLTPAGAAAVVALLAAALAAIIALAALLKMRSRPQTREDESLVGRLIELARERPIIAAGAAAAAGFVLLRNPGLLITAAMAGRASRQRPSDRDRRR